MTACPFCQTIFMSSHDIGEECPQCEIGTLISIEEYLKLIENYRENMRNDDDAEKS